MILDGAMATELFKLGLPKNNLPDFDCIEFPHRVETVHRSYVKAGSQLLFTNTFGSSRPRLKELGREKEFNAIQKAAVRIAKKSAGDSVQVFGCVGPIGTIKQPFSSLSFYDAATAYQEQIAALGELGVDGIVLETQFTASEIKTACVVADDLCRGQIPVYLSMTVNTSGLLVDGTDPLTLFPYLEENHVSIVGFNCSEGPASILPLLEKAKTYPHRFTYAAKPNAGLPDSDGNYSMTPEAFGNWGRKLKAAGADWIGGCCGTSPEHIKMLSSH